jgi:hypothetical protein
MSKSPFTVDREAWIRKMISRLRECRINLQTGRKVRGPVSQSK